MGLVLQQLGPEAKLKLVKGSKKVIQQLILEYYTDYMELSFHLFILIDFHEMKVFKYVTLPSTYSPAAEKKPTSRGQAILPVCLF